VANLAAQRQQGVLPSEFGVARGDRVTFGFDRWVRRANDFRELVEPFDIAHYYWLQLDRTEGHYLHYDNRPLIYVRLEDMWLQYCRQQWRPSATFKSSVAWAEAMMAVHSAPAPAGTALPRVPPVLPADTPPLVNRPL
jgi:Enhanced disease susceptibility 1 protein EP domain